MKTVPPTISFLNPISWNLQLLKVDSSTLCDLGMFTFIFIQQSSEDLNRDNPRIKIRQQSFVWKVTHDIKFTVHIVFILYMFCNVYSITIIGERKNFRT